MTKLFFLIFIFSLSINSQAQKEDSVFKLQGYSFIISLAQFNKIVDSCTQLLKAKKFAEISDGGNIYIIMCHNTIMFTDIREGSPAVIRYEGDRFDRFMKIFYADNSAYSNQLSKTYQWKPSHGLGLYFPKLDMQLGGSKDRHSIFGVTE
jgi:hypothetical protein